MVEQSKNTIESVTGSLEELAKAIMQKELVEKQDVVSLVQYCKNSIDNFNHTNGNLYDLMKACETSNNNGNTPNPLFSSLVEEYKRLEADLLEEKKSLDDFFVKKEPIILFSATGNEQSEYVTRLLIHFILMNWIKDKVIVKLMGCINKLNKE